MSKKKDPDIPRVHRKCDCWIGQVDADKYPEPMECYCPLEEGQSTRYSVQKFGEIYARFETINECLKDGRKRVTPPFKVYDHVEERFVIDYE